MKRVHFREESKNVYKKLDIIIIDEVSMVRADLLDCVDRFLRLNGPRKDIAFGGVQMAFIGDLYQLPPVVTGAEMKAFGSLYETPYFFNLIVIPQHLQRACWVRDVNQYVFNLAPFE